MLPGDITHLTSLSRPALAPDGRFAVYASSRPDLRADRAVGQLWRVDLLPPDAADGTGAARLAGPPRRLTRGVSDTSPALSPDGRVIAFLRADDRGRRQIHLVDSRGGEPRAITAQLLGVDAFTWSPDGSRLAFTARAAEPGRYGDVPGLAPEAERPRRVTGPRWHANGVGWTADRPAHVFVVPAVSVEEEPAYPVAPHPDGPLAPAPPVRCVRLTAGRAEHGPISFDAAGEQVLAVREDPAADIGDLRTEVIAIPAPEPATGPDGGTDGSDRDGPGGDGPDGEAAPAEPRILVPREEGLRIQRIGIGPGGIPAILASRPIEGRDPIAPDVSLWLLEEAGLRRLTDPETLDVGAAGSEIIALGEDVLLRAARRGRVHLVRVRPDGEVREVVAGDAVVGGADAVRVSAAPAATNGDDDAGRDRRGPREIVLAALASPVSSGMLVAAGADPVAPGLLVDAGASLREVTEIAPSQELEIIGRSGYPVHGWLTLPPGAAAGGDAAIPLILLIHGGPYAAYDVALFDEVQTLVEEGYAVVHGNPRGSAGYGRAHGRAVKGAFGTVDAEDVIDLLEGALAADPRLDDRRLGIMGGSYGGYLTAWIIAHDHRFRGAIVERGFLDPVSFQGTSDIGSYFGDQYIGTALEDIDRQSAFARAGDVRTPTLVIHSEQDLRCPLEQGTRYYAALQRAGVETEMLVFPGEDHELTRSGRPRHRVERFEAVLEWWERRLGGA